MRRFVCPTLDRDRTAGPAIVVVPTRSLWPHCRTAFPHRSERLPVRARSHPRESGDHVTIDLVSTDVVHGLYLDGYDLNVTADPGQTATLSFVADRSGSFRFRCSVTCGALHPS